MPKLSEAGRPAVGSKSGQPRAGARRHEAHLGEVDHRGEPRVLFSDEMSLCDNTKDGGVAERALIELLCAVASAPGGEVGQHRGRSRRK